MLTLKRGLPLYQGLGYVEKPEDQGIQNQPFFSRHANIGLYFDKFIDTWGITGTNIIKQAPASGKKDSKKSKQGSVKAFLEEIIEYYNDISYKNVLRKMLNGYHERKVTLHDALFSGTCVSSEKFRFDLKTEWRFVSGLGNGHPFDTGFVWHRTLGVPYLPGSSVKGLIRAWARQWLEETRRVDELLGSEGSSAETRATSGKIIIFDALPITPPQLTLDILNPHYGPYYEDSGKAPADYHNPVPVFFLTVAKGTYFSFSLAPRPEVIKPITSKIVTISEDLETVKGWLVDALENIGCGAKTAVGYGRLSLSENAAQTDYEIWENATVRLNAGSGEIIAFSDGKAARENIAKNEELKNFVNTLGKKRIKNLKGGGINANVRVCGSGNNYKLVVIVDKNVTEGNSE